MTNEGGKGISSGVVIVIVIIAIIVAGGGTYFYMSQQLEKQKTDYTNQVTDLQNQVKKLEDDKAKEIIEGAIDAAGKIKDKVDQNSQEQDTSQGTNNTPTE